MNFLEKDLETIIWENYKDCLGRGLSIGQLFFGQGLRYRQLNLGPYGIADLVYIRYVPPLNQYEVQIIELKKGKVDVSAYLQAQRYAHAVRSVLHRIENESGEKAAIFIQRVLIGSEVDSTSDFVFLLNSDSNCLAFTFNYGFNGIEFHDVGKEWGFKSENQSSSLVKLAGEVRNERLTKEEAEQNYLLEFGNDLLPLILTPEGIHVNYALLGTQEGGHHGA